PRRADLRRRVAVEQERRVREERQPERHPDDEADAGDRPAAETGEVVRDEGEERGRRPPEVHQVRVGVAHVREVEPERAAVGRGEAEEDAGEAGEGEEGQRAAPGPAEGGCRLHFGPVGPQLTTPFAAASAREAPFTQYVEASAVADGGPTPRLWCGLVGAQPLAEPGVARHATGLHLAEVL